MKKTTVETAHISESALLPAGDWRVDLSRSRIGFTVRKLGVGTLCGRFEVADGAVVVDAAQVAACGTVRVASVATGNDDRDAHLRAPSFFAADTFPEIAFRSRHVAAVDERRWRISGDLTIRDHMREVELIASQPSGRNVPARLRVRGEIDRREFGLTWSRAIEATGAVSTTVRIELDLELIRAASLRSPVAA
jgi:polyisoprenoid-binding protein YceI